MLQKLIYALAIFASLTLTACNTVEGVGRDVQSAGRGLSEEAQEHKPK
jgi:predicted small secreted protein